MIRFFYNSLRHIYAAILVAAAASLAGCDSFIYDDEGDCDPYYKVRFVYDMNMKFADAFPQEVYEVTLYVVDYATGKIVWSHHESSEALRQDGYLMDVDGLEPGTYSLIAWAGEGHTTSFAVREATRHTDLQCSLIRTRGENGNAESRNDLKRLYHGKLMAQTFPDEQGVHVYTVPLVKNTNDIHIVLQHLNGTPVDADDFIFTVEDANGNMDWDNSLMPDETITYHAWAVNSASAGVDIPEELDPDAHSRAITNVSACVADLTVARLMEDRRDKAMLKVYNADSGENIISVPLVDYCLMVKGHYRPMDDQEYLDRQDDYSMVFFLDRNDKWLNTVIMINSWKVIIQNTGV